jgi:two-component system chemotaxis sensor kinase CheA
MSGIDELRISFFQECEDLLEKLSDGLREMSEAPGDMNLETIHSVFRAVHSIKGGAGAFGLENLVAFAHAFETVLDQMRAGKTDAYEKLMPTLLRAGDMLADLVICARDGTAADDARITKLLAELDTLADGAGANGGGGEPFEFVPTALEIEPINETKAHNLEAFALEKSIVHIKFAPNGKMYCTGNEPLALFRALAQFGDVGINPEISNIQPISCFDPDEPKLCWELHLVSDATDEEIYSVFEFVSDLAEISLERDTPLDGENPTASAVEIESQESKSSQERNYERMGEHQERNSIGIQIQGTTAPITEKTSETTLETPADPPTKATSAVEKVRRKTDGPEAKAPPTIRVNLDRVDRLINLIGELVIMEAMLSQAVKSAGIDSDSEISNGLEGIKQLASSIQESVMAIRAQPLKPVFQRMHRILREASDATGKQVRLETAGETTEVDKTVIEKLVDPLTHMIRNSVDHGLEDGPARISSGKPETGTIILSAVHRSGRVIIEVSDDGAGIDRDKVREIAATKGLISPDASLAPAEIDNLLFAPGFSSKEEVSELSGRGVGLDVVKREIQSLGGRVGIQSVAGKGTTFSIALPLTLAVLEGMLVEFDGEMMVLPLSAILETLRPSSATIHTIGRASRVLASRGDLIPIIDLAEALGFRGNSDNTERNVFLLVECETGRRAALAVDAIHDQRQVVIKSLEENYGAIPGVSAATILGDGKIALIVDPEEIISSASPEIPSLPLAANE